jgi:hypothetical protein
VTTLTLDDWSAEDDRAAAREGWSLFESDGSADGTPQVQRIDDPGPGETELDGDRGRLARPMPGWPGDTRTRPALDGRLSAHLGHLGRPTISPQGLSAAELAVVDVQRGRRAQLLLIVAAHVDRGPVLVGLGASAPRARAAGAGTPRSSGSSPAAADGNAGTPPTRRAASRPAHLSFAGSSSPALPDDLLGRRSSLVTAGAANVLVKENDVSAGRVLGQGETPAMISVEVDGDLQQILEQPVHCALAVLVMLEAIEPHNEVPSSGLARHQGVAEAVRRLVGQEQQLEVTKPSLKVVDVPGADLDRKQFLPP